MQLPRSFFLGLFMLLQINLLLITCSPDPALHQSRDLRYEVHYNSTEKLQQGGSWLQITGGTSQRFEQSAQGNPDPLVSRPAAVHKASASASPDPCQVLSGVYVNCSSRGWASVPSTPFPIQIQVYDLSKNRLTSLPSQAFARYTALVELYLNENRISAIDPLAFKGLSSLEVLSLQSNELVMNDAIIHKAFSEQVFVPLSNLRKLRLERNNPNPGHPGLRYPEKALSHLTSLEELCLDGFENAVFESGFANLTRLRNLSLDGYKYGHCELYGLKNKTFQYLSSLYYLSITDCKLQGNGIQAGAFLPLVNLISLNISMNQDINVQFFDRVFYGLQNTTSLRTLEMQFVVNLYTIGVCLSSRYIKYFPQSIEYLNARENKLQCIDRNVADIVKSSLKFLDISKNAFVFGTYLLDLPKFKDLIALYIDDYQFNANRLPTIYPFNPRTPPLESDNCSLYAKTEEEDGEHQRFILRLPPNLKAVTVRYAGLRYILTNLTVDPNNSLENLTMEGVYVPVLEGPLTGLTMVKNFHFVANKIYHISEHFFETLLSLERLNLSSNRLGELFEEYPGTAVFHPLLELTSLDLASNTIRVLGATLFHGLNKLEYLSIAHNPIYRFYPDISHMHKLQAFIASDTSLSFLPEETRNAITLRVENGSSFQADLQMSPIFCDCENLPFIKWMVNSKAFNFTNKAYTCRYPDTSSINIHDGYAEALLELNRKCTSMEPLFLIVGAITIAIIVFVIAALAYRFRWKIRYMYHAAYNHLRSDRDARDTGYEYDVFACYADVDRDFVTDILAPALAARGLSVFIHHRHFRAGELIGDNIVRAVNTCKRTVVVLTRALADSDWCNYEIQMANQETAKRGTPVLIFLLFDDMNLGRMSRPELLYNVQNNTYIEFPSFPLTNEDDSFKTQWDMLARDIKS